MSEPVITTLVDALAGEAAGRATTHTALLAALAALEAEMRAVLSVESGTQLAEGLETPMMDDRGRALERRHWADRLTALVKEHGA